MKKLLPAGIILAIFALALWGNRLAGRVLDAELGALLTREIGIPTILGPIKANVLRLTASTPKLVMGSPENPALVATGVEVSLAWPDLLKGEIRLVQASGNGLVIEPSRWPANDAPWPKDYSFLEPLLPRELQLESARYLDAAGNNFDFGKLTWQRIPDGGASLAATQYRGKEAIGIGVELKSLADLLHLDRMALELTTTAAGKDDSTLSAALDLRPGDGSGYKLDARVRAAGLQARVTTGNDQPWQFPARSSIHIEQLEPGPLRQVLGSYTSPDTAAAPDPAATLPRLSLPDHAGKVIIDKLAFREEVLTATAFDFTTGGRGLAITSLTSQGPAGELQGGLNIASAGDGWTLKLAADIRALQADHGLAPAFLDARWLWCTGRARLESQGDTWAGLLYSLAGEIDLDGSYRGTREVPVSIRARLDNRTDVFALEEIDLRLDQGRITGSLEYGDADRRRLAGTLRAEQLHLDFLLADSAKPSPPGIAIPTFLDALPGVELDWDLEIADLHVNQLHISRSTVKLTRTPALGQLLALATEQHGGTVDLRLTALRHQDRPSDASLQVKFKRFNLPRMFGQGTSMFDTRTSGAISFVGRGHDVTQVFEDLQGTADLTTDFRVDHDWRRSANPGELMRISGSARFVIEQQRLLGLQISELAVDSVLQNLTGTLSMVDGRSPWLVAELQSDKLDIPQLVGLQSGDQPSRDDLLERLRKLDALSVSLAARRVTLDRLPLTGLQLKLSSGDHRVALEQLDFSTTGGRLQCKGGISWTGDQASFSATARASNFELDKFLISDSGQSVPVSGTLSLQSAGRKLPELLAGLHGDIQFSASTGPGGVPPKSPRRLAMSVKRIAGGMEAVINSFQWGDSDLAGTVTYRDSQPPRFDLVINRGSLSLLPWEKAATPAKDLAGKESADLITRTARASADFVSDLLLAPLHWVQVDEDKTPPGEKLFSTSPLPFDWLGNYEGSVKGRLDTVNSQVGSARDLVFSASLAQGRLGVEASAGQLNGGSVDTRLSVDTTVQPTRIELTGNFSDIRGTADRDSFPRSGYVSLTSQGDSEASLAANLNGLFYLKLGAGPLDYENLRLLTASVATNVIETLIPGAKKRRPKLQCGATLMAFHDGIGTTPYGYAARTREANLVGRIQIDLRKELLQLDFSSSSRKGLGFSVGSMFANTVQVEGPLTDPKIVPRASSLLWRGWAAVMTGGLSVVGESVLKRALASDDPCDAVDKHIRKDLCKAGQPTASSPLVCPANS